MTATSKKARLAVHKFSSCDGCQLALLNAIPAVLALADRIDILHFAEAGQCDPEAEVDIALVEGSISTPSDEERIRLVRANSRILISIGACATSGGLQALRNLASHDDWRRAIYTNPEHIRSLDTSTPIAAAVKVDHELWGCPVNSRQLLECVQSLLLGGEMETEFDSVCGECKRQGNPCVMVTHGKPCMGPVTRAGCGAICPGFARDCYGCYGPASLANSDALAARFADLGLDRRAIADRFLGINNHAPTFHNAGLKFK